MEHIIIIGAGPCGLSAAVELKRRGFDPLIIEKGAIVESIYRYPTFLHFHSTPERLEIGDVPFTTPNEKPTRLEGLTYYRMVAQREKIRIHLYETVTSVRKVEGLFQLETTDRFGEVKSYESRAVIVATGYFDQPNRLNVPGEDLPHVSHYFQEAHPYAGLKVVVVGGNNSAVDAALELERVGADVTVVYRGEVLSPYVKSWVKPLFESSIDKGNIEMHFSTQITKITERTVHLVTREREWSLAADFVLALTGFRPDRVLLQSSGVQVNEETGAPAHDPETFETNVPNLFIAGVIAAGSRANEIFIENGRFHGKAIADVLTKRWN
ncbi:YpdA family putative bacillithiol disulfide reductase [Paenibacillus senegalensis]|uniref:YpdA family putative bacillithiol disulfide reductase n=1 Tax=Paenibacillus senegalensis TaxID=1465766 RepID=UPI000287E565|nr:YpdA family putative bacillithiol disulfide reductase [Paenibacillus senegalensis]